MFDICKNYVEDCCNDLGPCPFLGDDHWCHKNLVEYYLEKVFNINKNKSSKYFIYIVDNPSYYEQIDGLVLKRLGHEVTFQKKASDFGEQLRQADALADYVYVEKELFDDNGYLMLRASKNINAVGVDMHVHTNCRNLGLINFLNFNQNKLFKKKVLVYGDDIDLVDKLVAAGAVVTVTTNMNIEHRDYDLIIVLEKEKPLNCYPIHIPVIDVANACINIESRDVVLDCHWFNVLGVLEQIW